MKRSTTIVAIWAASLFCAAGAPACAADVTGWPKTGTVNGYTYTAYEPQVDSWENYHTLTARVAVAITQPGAKEPTYGVVGLTAATVTDADTRAVKISNVQVVSVNFPAVSADVRKKLDAYVRKNVKLSDSVVPAETIVASMQQNAAAQNVPIKTDPPALFYSDKPALLVVYDGDPVFSPIKDLTGDLTFAINTNWNVFQSGSKFYLLASDHWLQASSAKGPWSPAGALPAVFAQLPATDNWSDARANLNAAPLSAAQLPTVWVSTTPAEAIVTDGAPKFDAMPGTQLSFVSNSPATVVFDQAGKNYYYLSSGRWFSASSLSGPWSFASEKLPADFKKIPASGPLGFVLPSVPGTSQSQEALIEAQIPHEAQITRSAATLTVKYTGDPQFQPIPGTSMLYAANTSTDVIKASNGKYYACENAVWFVGDTPTGPWTVTDKVPDEIYTITPESPVYQDTYVTVTQSNTSSVWFAFTAGYLLAYPWHYGYYYGTGWWYNPWYGNAGRYPIYYPWPRTYVGGAYYNPATGAYGRGYAVRGPYGGATIGGGYNPSTGTYWRGGAVYGPNGGVGRGAVYNPATGEMWRGAAAWGPNGAVGCAQGKGCASTGGRYGSANQASPYKSWGNNVARQPSVNVPSTRPAGGAAMTLPAGGSLSSRPSTLPAAPSRNDVFAGKDGNVYKPATGGGWSQYDNRSGAWQGARPPTAGTLPAARPNTPAQPSFNRPVQQPVNTQTVQGLQRDSAARNMGAASFGGGARGGGGGRGR